MTGFDLIVRLFGLLLGLAIAEVLGGFARTVRFKLGLTPIPPATSRVGWLTPLLGLLVVMDQMSFWLAFYALQSQIPFGFLSMLAVLFLIGGFYILSGLVFPTHPERWSDFDEYYFRVRTVVVGGLLALNLAVLAFATAIMVEGGEIMRTGAGSRIGSAASIAFLPILGSLLVMRRPGASLVLLVLGNAALLIEAFSHSR